jgi:uncharacterized membrane protein (UPF0127 family)
VLAGEVEVARGFLSRGLGLMFRRSFPAGRALWIDPCDGIHMFWMNFPIDAVFLDRKQRVVKVCHRLGRWRVIPFVWGARSVVELPAGTLDGLELKKGDPLELVAS